MSDRRLAREIAVQTLYEMDQAGDTWPRPLADNAARRNATPASRSYAERLVRTVTENRAEIQQAVAGALENWALDRVAMVDRCVLEVGAAEILKYDDVPVAVAIDEAVAIVRKFSTDESGAFVNGVLDRIARTRAPGSGS